MTTSRVTSQGALPFIGIDGFHQQRTGQTHQVTQAVIGPNGVHHHSLHRADGQLEMEMKAD